MVKLDKHIRVTGFIAMAIAIATMVLLVVNAVHNGILAEDTPLIQGMKLLGSVPLSLVYNSPKNLFEGRKCLK